MKMPFLTMWSIISLLILIPTDVLASETEMGTVINTTPVFSEEITGSPTDTSVQEHSPISSLNTSFSNETSENTTDSVTTTAQTNATTQLHDNSTVTLLNSSENQTFSTWKSSSPTPSLSENTTLPSTTVPATTTAETTTVSLGNSTDVFNTTAPEIEPLLITTTAAPAVMEQSTDSAVSAQSMIAVVQETTTMKSQENATVTSSLMGNFTQSHTENATVIPFSTSKTVTTSEELMESFTSSTTSTNGTLERRSTYSSHMCVTSETCQDPNSHCVNSAGRNICLCREGFVMNDTIGLCVTEPPISYTEQPETETTTNSSLNETTRGLEDFNENTTQMNNQITTTKREFAILASQLSRQEGLGVVSIALEPATSVVQWILEKDGKFRKALADIITATNFSVKGDDGISVPITTTVLPEHIIYVAPSPQMSTNGILISFLIEDHDGITSHLSQYSTISHRRRDISSITLYLPAVWIVRAIRASQRHLEEMLNQTISWLADGPSAQLFTSEILASTSLFERRLDIFVPLILVAAICCLALALGLACVRAKARNSATWDPPAGVVYGKTTLKREDPLGSATRCPPGCDLATDEQCREGEDHKNNIGSCDEDVWVVPYDDDNNQNNRLKTQFEDTKL